MIEVVIKIICQLKMLRPRCVTAECSLTCKEILPKLFHKIKTTEHHWIPLWRLGAKSRWIHTKDENYRSISFMNINKKFLIKYFWTELQNTSKRQFTQWKIKLLQIYKCNLSCKWTKSQRSYNPLTGVGNVMTKSIYLHGKSTKKLAIGTMCLNPKTLYNTTLTIEL